MRLAQLRPWPSASAATARLVMPFHKTLSTSTGKPKPKPLPSARMWFNNTTEVHIVGTRHTDGSVRPVQRMVRSLPPKSAVAFEQCVLQTLVTLRHSEFDGATPLPPQPLEAKTRLAVDSDLALVAEWQTFFAKHMDFDKFYRGMGRFPHVVSGGVEHLAGMRQAQSQGLPIWLLDMPASVVTAKIEAYHKNALAKSWIGIRPLRQGPRGYIEPAMGMPSLADTKTLVLGGHVPSYLNPLMVDERDRYMVHMLLANLHRTQAAGEELPPIVAAFVGAEHVAGIEKHWNAVCESTEEEHRRAVRSICELEPAAAAAPTPAADAAEAAKPAEEEDEYYYYDDDDDDVVQGGEADDAWRACAAQVEPGYWKARTTALLEKLQAAGLDAHRAAPSQ